MSELHDKITAMAAILLAADRSAFDRDEMREDMAVQAAVELAIKIYNEADRQLQAIKRQAEKELHQ